MLQRCDALGNTLFSCPGRITGRGTFGASLCVSSALALVWASLWESFELWHLIGGFLVASLLLDGLSRLLDNKSNQV